MHKIMGISPPKSAQDAATYRTTRRLDLRINRPKRRPDVANHVAVSGSWGGIYSLEFGIRLEVVRCYRTGGILAGES